MAKRFTDIDKWTKNKWFRRLSPESKLFWFYITESCDSVGVWEEDIDLASLLIGYEYSIDTLLIDFEKQIEVLPNGKWWIKNFVEFQYGVLTENENNKPHQSYIKLLKYHDLYEYYKKSINTLSIGYSKTINSLKDKDKDMDMDMEKDTEKEMPQKVKISASQEGKEFAEFFKTLLPETQNVTNSDLENWAKTFDDLVKIDKRDPNEIREVCEWARKDEFWKVNFLSAKKLRTKDKNGVMFYDVFLNKMKIGGNNGKSKLRKPDWF